MNHLAIILLISKLLCLNVRPVIALSSTPRGAGMVGLAPKWVRLALAPNGTNPGLFQIRILYIWRGGAKCTEI